MDPDARDPFTSRSERLESILGELEGVAVAFSGGVDSAVLLHAARAVLGSRAVGVIADSPSLPRRELEEARRFAAGIGAELAVLATSELDDPRYRRNDERRCYFCKSALFEAMAAWAGSRGIATLAFGEIADDRLDDRPGAAAARERGVRAPLSEAGFTKEDVRRYAREHGLAVADKPASACLASRIARGSEVSAEALARVELAEEALKSLGLRQLRVRDRGSLARVEVGAGELDRARALAPRLGVLLEPLGYADLELSAYVPPAERRPAGSGNS